MYGNKKTKKKEVVDSFTIEKKKKKQRTAQTKSSYLFSMDYHKSLNFENTNKLHKMN